MFAAFFFTELMQHWFRHRSATYLLWWAIGVFFYGAGTITESIHALAGYSPANFKVWYIFGALLGGAPLAQGTVYLLLKKQTAHILTIILVCVILVAGVLVILSPLKPIETTGGKLGGKLLEWSYIRAITPFINIYAFVFLVGGACYSAYLYYRTVIDKSKFWGIVLIAAGGLLPGIGGSFSKFGHIEVLYVTEFIGICMIHAGYQKMKESSAPSVHSNQR
ncbi:hypothetical protein CAP35_14725 [Chitinophagaceae bacterium IBVUCB1]|nr:hypothetical protein CAP35_14725 [Chitinophagaceae bacterium IBVUCB1]